MPQIPPAILTPEQQKRKEMGLPYTGSQPAIVFTDASLRDENLGIIELRKRYYVCDGRYGSTDIAYHAGICLTHAFDLFQSTPGQVTVMFGLLQAIDRRGRYSGSGRFFEVEFMKRDDVEGFRDSACTREARELAAKYPGQTLEEASRPYTEAHPLARPDILKLVQAVTHQYRLVEGPLRYDADHAQRLADAFQPRPSF